MKTFIIGFSLCIIFFSSITTAAQLANLSPLQLQAMLDQKALVIDIRTEQEWLETGIIPDSVPLEFFNTDGDFDTQLWLKHMNEYRAFVQQPIILVCRSGNRSSLLGNFLTRQLGMNNIYHLEKGIVSWQKAQRNIAQICPSEHALCKQN